MPVIIDTLPDTPGKQTNSVTATRSSPTSITLQNPSHTEGNTFFGTLTNLNNSNSSYTVFFLNSTEREILAAKGILYCLSLYTLYSNGSISETAFTNIYISNSIKTKSSKLILKRAKSTPFSLIQISGIELGIAIGIPIGILLVCILVVSLIIGGCIILKLRRRYKVKQDTTKSQ